MATMSPILERRINTTNTDYSNGNNRFNNGNNGNYSDTHMFSDERHNSCIRENYARLLNPDYTSNEIMTNIDKTSQSVRVNETQESVETPVNYAQYSSAIQQEQPHQEVYLVQNARADSPIFRADNPINKFALRPLKPGKNAISRDLTVETKSEVSNEENAEDLCPTITTQQYKTETPVAEKVSVKSENKMSQRDKIIICTLIAAVVVLFALVIINSAIIANLNSQVNTLETNVDTAKSTFEQIWSKISDYVNSINFVRGN